MSMWREWGRRRGRKRKRRKPGMSMASANTTPPRGQPFARFTLTGMFRLAHQRLKRICDRASCDWSRRCASCCSTRVALPTARRGRQGCPAQAQTPRDRKDRPKNYEKPRNRNLTTYSPQTYKTGDLQMLLVIYPDAQSTPSVATF